MIWVKLLLLDDLLAAFTTSMLLRADCFLCNRPIWDGKAVKDKTWPA